ncbi:MAG: valine--tRNA ligase, partial [Treponema sp.]|nr:valine--tRNA ligase [Treponema sp.]
KIMSNETYSDLLVTAPYPEFSATRENAEITARFAALQDLIRSVRGLRNECGVNPADKINLAVLIEKGSAAEVCCEKVEMIQLLAGLSKVEFVDAKPTNSIGTGGTGFEAFIILDENINKEQLMLHFQKDLEKDKKEAERTEAKLGGKFAEHAPAEVVQAERDKLAETKRRIEKLGTYIEALK